MWAAHEGMGWWMLFGGFFWLAFFGALVYFVVGALGGRTGPPQTRPDTPLDIAKRRLASGEISEEEYGRIRDALSG